MCKGGVTVLCYLVEKASEHQKGEGGREAGVYLKGEMRLALFRLVFTKSNRKPSKRL